MIGRLIICALVVAVAMAGCTSPPPAGPRERLRAAADRLERAGTAAVRVEATYHNGPAPVSIVSSGLIDIAHRRYDVKARLPRTGTVRRVYAEALAYEWRPVTGWTVTDVDAAIRGSSAFGLGHLASNPVLLLDLLQAAQRPVERGGTIRAEADVSRLRERDPIWSVLAGQVRSGPAGSAGTVPVQVGTDGEGRANLLRVTLPLPEAGTARGARPEVDVTVRLSRYGTTADIAPPPPERVRDITAQVTRPAE